MSTVAKSPDLDATNARLLQNPKDLANLYADFYPKDITDKIDDIITQHLTIAGDLVTALRDGDTQKAAQLDKQWHQNADEWAAFFASFNPNYNEKEIKDMLYNHLALTGEEAKQQIAGNYPASINAFNQIENQALMMADYFANGLL